MNSPTHSAPDWNEAMWNAGVRLRMIDEMIPPGESKRGVNPGLAPLYSAHAAVAQAWLAYARELTMRERSQR